MDNQVIFGGQINMQNNMRTIHVGIFHLFQKTKKKKKKKKKNMLGIKKNPDTAASHHCDATLVANSTELRKSRNSEFLYYFSFQRSANAQASLSIFVNST